MKIKGPEAMQEAMQHYLQTQLHHDHGMQAIVQAQDYFAHKIDRFV